MKKIIKLIIGNKKTKRWILLIIIGMLLTCYEFAKILVTDRLELTELVKIAILFIIGFTCFILGLVFLQRRILELAANPEIMKSKNPINSKGPNIVVIGGGNGLSTVLKGLKKYTSNITAIVTVSKYGKEDISTAEDIKISLEALAKNSEEMSKILNYNFSDSKGEQVNFGDLYIEVARNINGNLATSVQKSNEIFSMIGKVLPVTLDEMKICVELDNGMVIKDKDKIADITEERVTKINRVFVNPSNCRTAPGIVEAIQNADAIILGPGSLYTNVIPNLLIKNVAKTIRDSKAFKIYIPNIMTQPGHTDDYNVSDHIDAIIEHAGNKIIDYCICDNGDIIPEFLRKYNKEGSNLVEVDAQNLRGKGIKLIRADISCVEGEYIRHDADALAKTIIELICNELKFRDKQNDDQYLLLNSKLKEEKKKNKKKISHKAPTKKPKRNRKASKFISKYSDRIKSIQESEQTREQNIKKEQQKNTKKNNKKIIER
ncbi:MAG: uridine diphosphate-N-acetylglucosamine-binding protein YvcK [Clostridia bacterium]